MKRGPVMAIRMKRLPLRHRIAHLRALIRQQPAHSIRREELVALLRALARMKLENSAHSRRGPSKANAVQSSGQATANADRSHSHQILLKGETGPADPAGQQSERGAGKPSVAVSPELLVYLAKRTT